MREMLREVDHGHRNNEEGSTDCESGRTPLRELKNRHAEAIKTASSGFHLRGCRGSFLPKQLNFPPKLTILPPQEI
jgi:hypothetical protein